MAYIGWCDRCNYMYSSVSLDDVEQKLLKHAFKSHGDSFTEDDLRTARIPSQMYADYIRNKGNAKFWEAWRLRKKVRTLVLLA